MTRASCTISDMPNQTSTATRVETVDGTSRCRNCTARGRQCANYTARVLVTPQPGHADYRTSDCGRHK